MTYQCQKTDLLIYKAVLGDNWDLVSKTFQDHSELQTKPINWRLETPLMIAVGTNQSHNFVRNLLHSLPNDDLITHVLDAQNDEGDTALKYAAKVGNTVDSILLVSRIREVTSAKDPMTPVRDLSKAYDAIKYGSAFMSYSAWLGKKEMLDLLFFATDDVLSREIQDSFTSKVRMAQSFFGSDLITLAIDAEHLDVALALVYSKTAIHIRETWNAQRSLHVLARKPQVFLRGRGLGFWGNLIYSSSPIKNIYKRHWQAKVLLKHICNIVITNSNQDIVSTILGSTIATAIEFGNYEVIEECIFAYPSIVWANIEGFSWLHKVIKQRQEKVYNLVYQMSSYKVFVASRTNGNNENLLHIAAQLAPPHRLNTITGAALQMQRELQWFEEINTFVGPSQREALNAYGKTPRMVFTDEHTELLKEAKKWMKGTASSSTVIATLIVTVAFAAVFKLRAGDENKITIAFMFFIISDAVALFSSATSVLMFLGILTSRNAEKDFLCTLPRRLTIGLVSLFMSLAATMIAFSATLALVLQDELPWIVAPLVIMTSIPVVLFGVLQFPLFKDLIHTTYGRPIFGKQNNRIIH